MYQLLRNHWHGQHNLLLTVFVALLGVRVVLGVLQPLVPVAAIGYWVVLSVLILVWQLVGAWRAGDNHLRDDGGAMLHWLGILSMVVVAVLTLLQIADALVRRLPPALPPPVTETVLPIDDSGTVVTLSGPLTWEMHTALEQSLRRHQSIRQVNLASDGGLVFGARALALLIQRYQLNTHVASGCYSACTLVFMAGAERTLAATGSLGFHQYAIDEPNRVQTINVREELDRDRHYLLAQGASEAFVKRVFQAAPSDMWIPSHSLLREAGVLTADRPIH